jgi:CRISPR-associated protein Csb2
MFALEAEFLTSRYVASLRGDRSVAEWPPHPNRLFSALAAALFECDFGTDAKEALTWLEKQEPPAISASEPSFRTPVTSFVPTNDKNDFYVKRGAKVTVFAKIDEGIDLRRNRQPRYFPTVVPQTATVVYCWPNSSDAEVNQCRPALQRLAENVTYLGHSSSLVRVAICNDPPEPTLRPAPDGELADVMLRVPGPGRLDRLKSAYDLSLVVNRRIEPPEGRFRGYVRTCRAAGPTEAHGVFDERMIVFRRKQGCRLPLRLCLQLASTVRSALIELAEQPVPEMLSGRQDNGEKSDQPHTAIVPLPNIGSRYSDGTIMGFAIVVPHALSEPARAAERRAVLAAIGRLTTLHMGSAGAWEIERVTAESRYKSLQPTRYTVASRCWATVTPVVFGRFPDTLYSEEAQNMVREQCRMIGLPSPLRVELLAVSPVLGVPPSAQFPTLSTDGKPVATLFEKGRHRLPRPSGGHARPRVRSHVLIDFERPVRGPVLLGAGRYLGMGLCLPVLKSRLHGSEL